MNTITLEIPITQKVEVPFLCERPVYAENAEHYDLLKNIRGIARMNWEGDLIRVFMFNSKQTINNVNIGLFETVDKGRPGLFGLDADGKVICSLAEYEGDRSQKHVLLTGPHIHLEKCSDTSSASW